MAPAKLHPESDADPSAPQIWGGCIIAVGTLIAERPAWARKLRRSKIQRSTRLRAHVEDCLAIGWSPEQIAGRMELYGLRHPISDESIYRLRLQPHRPARGPAAPARRRAKRSGADGTTMTPAKLHPKSDADPSAPQIWGGCISH